MINPFQFNSYRDIFKSAIDQHPQKGRGLRTNLAKFLRCQSTHISHVIAGRLNFTLEQGEAACRYFKFTPNATEYTLILISLERAGSQELKAHYAHKASELITENQQVKNIVTPGKKLSHDQRAQYYSHWHYAAVHMCLSIKQFTSPATNLEAMAQYLRLPEQLIAAALDFFDTCGIIRRDQNGTELIEPFLHIDNHMLEISQHHRNLRSKAMDSLAWRSEQDLYFSAFLTCEYKDKIKIREILRQAIAQCAELVESSESQTLYGLNIDFYSF